MPVVLESFYSENRPGWTYSQDFLIILLSTSLNMGNMWRFPYAVFQNGGGTFLIAYAVVLILVIGPIYYLEVCLGQFTSRANVKMFEILAPCLKGIGCCQMIALMSMSAYNAVLLSLCGRYFISSFHVSLPWDNCKKSWTSMKWSQNFTCVQSTSVAVKHSNQALISSTQLFLKIELLQESYEIPDELGKPLWDLCVGLIVTWIITFVSCLIILAFSRRAVTYVLAFLPYIAFIALFIQSVSLSETTGTLFYIQPKWEKLLEAKIWYNAVTQSFFSLNVGFGITTGLASYNKFRHNLHKNYLIIIVFNTVIALFCSFIVFSGLEVLANKMNTNLTNVIMPGTELYVSFIAYSEVIALFYPEPCVISVIFYMSMYVVGLGSNVINMYCLYTIMADEYPKVKTGHMALIFIAVLVLLGIPFATPAGPLVLQVIDFFGVTFIAYFGVLLEILAVIYWYGLEQICEDIELMTKLKPGIYFRMCWALTCPLFLIAILLYFIVSYERMRFRNELFSAYFLAHGWVLFAFGIGQPLGWWIYETLRNKYVKYYPYPKMFILTISHQAWGPSKTSNYIEWMEFKENKRQVTNEHDRNLLTHILCILTGK